MGGEVRLRAILLSSVLGFCVCVCLFLCVHVLFVAEYIGVGLERDPVKGVRINPEEFHAVQGVMTTSSSNMALILA